MKIIEFINYNKKFKGAYPRRPWPTFMRYWVGKIWHLEWMGYAIVIDRRTHILADLVGE